jgi:hypothetical protein
MSRIDDRKSRNEQFLTTLADELNDTPVSDLLDDGDSAKAFGAGTRILRSSAAEARRRRHASARPSANESSLEEEAGRFEDEGVDE